MVVVTEEEIAAVESAAHDALQWPDNRREWSDYNKKQVFRCLFGCSPKIIAELWKLIGEIDDDEEKSLEEFGAKLEHLLYALVFLRVYGKNEVVHCAIFGHPSAKTYRKYSWYFVKKIAHLENKKYGIIVFDYRYKGDTGNNCLMTIDCLDCACFEPMAGHEFDHQMYSQKHNGPGLKYEMGVCIHTGHIVWINGPYKAGEMNDLQVFQDDLRNRLDENELVEADKGYMGDAKCKIP